MSESSLRVLVTGANSGLGKDAVRQLALRDNVEKVFLASRNKTKGEAALKDLSERLDKKQAQKLALVSLDVSNA